MPICGKGPGGPQSARGQGESHQEEQGGVQRFVALEKWEAPLSTPVTIILPWSCLMPRSHHQDIHRKETYLAPGACPALHGEERRGHLPK
jgi:hypothetical protein